MEIRPDVSSNGRFVTAASMLESRKQQNPARETAFEILDSVSQDDTQWSIVYDITDRSVHYKTMEDTTVRTIELNDPDFTCKTPVTFVDIMNDDYDSGESGFREFTSPENRELLRAVFDKYDHHNPGEVTLNEFLNLAEYGNSIKCNPK